LCGVVQLMQLPHYIVPEALYVSPILESGFMAAFIIPVWLVVLVPLYVLIPADSILWRWPLCTALGAIGGLVALVVGTWLLTRDFFVEEWSFYVMAAIVGSVTCLIGSLTKHWFKPSNKSLEPTAGRCEVHV
jgi:hypothetical protein